MTPKSLFQFIEKGFFLLTPLLLFLSLPSEALAHHILFYYNGANVNGAVLRCAALLHRAGHQVDVVDVAGKNHDPSNDNWGAPYDQVWDMRFINRDREECGSGSPLAADYFDERWRSKAVSFLNHCGKLFLAGEHYQLADRNEGLYKFLGEIHAVKEGYESCPPSRRGNSSTNGEAFYPVRHSLGPATFFGAYSGGIPMAYLSGTNFVDTADDWQGYDGVDRSIVSGWKGPQLGGAITAPACGRGRLFMVWDATMWTEWEMDAQAQGLPSAPVWDDNSWFSWDPDAQENKELGSRYRNAQAATMKFFPAAARWLGAGRDCPCETPANLPNVEPAESVEPGAETPAPRPRNVPRPLPTASPAPAPASTAPETIVFSEPPVNIYLRFRDGAGEYKVVIVDERGRYLRTVFDKRILTEKEAWTSWDGTREDGIKLTIGAYGAVLIKDGTVLRKIILSWITPRLPEKVR